jgi:asparagine synthase (glutamine-hydrolysing)
VDSSLITAVSSELTGKKLHSFSVSFDESVFDESEYQQRISRKYNTEHHDYRMTEDIFTKLLFESTWHYEHPLNDPNTVATYFLTKQAREYITVMLAGEGADEAFMGYSRFKPDVLSRLKNRNFFFRYPLVRETLRKLWPLKKGSKIFDITKYAPSMYALSYADTNFTHALLKGNDSAFRFRREVNNSGEGDVLAETILQYQLCDLTQWFWRADRMGMAASMELRVPFCAVPVFSLANSIPYSLHMSGGECKAVLKKVAEKYLGHDQIYRKKIGFGVPISEWIKKDGPYGKLFRELTQSPEFRNRPGIDIKHFDMIYKSFTAGSYKELNCAFLWTYFCFEIWYRTFFEEGWKKYRDIN